VEGGGGAVGLLKPTLDDCVSSFPAAGGGLAVAIMIESKKLFETQIFSLAGVFLINRYSLGGKSSMDRFYQIGHYFIGLRRVTGKLAQILAKIYITTKKLPNPCEKHLFLRKGIAAGGTRRNPLWHEFTA
jgi:hypothetical protein